MLRVAYATLFVALTRRSPFHGVYYNGERVRFDRGDDAARVCCFHSHIVRDIKLPFPDQRLVDRVAKNQLKSCHSMPLVKSLENVVSINWIMHLRYGFLAKNSRSKVGIASGTQTGGGIRQKSARPWSPLDATRSPDRSPTRQRQARSVATARLRPGLYADASGECRGGSLADASGESREASLAERVGLVSDCGRRPEWDATVPIWSAENPKGGSCAEVDKMRERT